MSGLIEMLVGAWNHPGYRILAGVVAIELVVIGVMMIGLWRQALRGSRYESRKQRLAAKFRNIAEGQSAADDAEEVEKRRSNLLRDVLVEFAQNGDHDRAHQWWRELDFAAEEHRVLNKGTTRQRLAAIRRLYVFADDGDRDAVMAALESERDHRFRLTAAQLLARLDRGEDVIAALGGLKLDRRTTEQPFYAVFRGLSKGEVERALDCDLSGLGDRVRWILFEIAAAHGIASVEKHLNSMATHEDLEPRLGACRIAAMLDGESGRSVLRQLLDDRDWQVRAQAVRGLGTNGSRADIPLLRERIGDDSFWVRENVGWALSRLTVEDAAPSSDASEPATGDAAVTDSEETGEPTTVVTG